MLYQLSYSRMEPLVLQAPLQARVCGGWAAARHPAPYDLRHSCATNLLSDGVPVEHVSKVLRPHKSVVVTQTIYIHSRAEDTANFMVRVPEPPTTADARPNPVTRLG